MKWYCETCKDTGHGTCPLIWGCSCCEDTMRGMLDKEGEG